MYIYIYILSYQQYHSHVCHSHIHHTETDLLSHSFCLSDYNSFELGFTGNSAIENVSITVIIIIIIIIIIAVSKLNIVDIAFRYTYILCLYIITTAYELCTLQFANVFLFSGINWVIFFLIMRHIQ